MLTVGVAFLGFLIATIVLGIGFWIWVRDEESGKATPLPRRRTETEIRCPICGNVYTAIPQDGMTVCPMCESYNEVRTPRRPGEV